MEGDLYSKKKEELNKFDEVFSVSEKTEDIESANEKFQTCDVEVVKASTPQSGKTCDVEVVKASTPQSGKTCDVEVVKVSIPQNGNLLQLAIVLEGLFQQAITNDCDVSNYLAVLLPLAEKMGYYSTYCNLSAQLCPVVIRQIVSQAIKKGDPLNNYWSELLHLAVEAESYQGVKQLIQAGADVDHRNEECLTPLHRAIKNGDKSIAELLLKEGANPYIKCKHGCKMLNALEYARDLYGDEWNNILPTTPCDNNATSNKEEPSTAINNQQTFDSGDSSSNSKCEETLTPSLPLARPAVTEVPDAKDFNESGECEMLKCPTKENGVPSSAEMVSLNLETSPQSPTWSNSNIGIVDHYKVSQEIESCIPSQENVPNGNPIPLSGDSMQEDGHVGAIWSLEILSNVEDDT